MCSYDDSKLVSVVCFAVTLWCRRQLQISFVFYRRESSSLNFGLLWWNIIQFEAAANLHHLMTHFDKLNPKVCIWCYIPQCNNRSYAPVSKSSATF